MSFLAPSDAIFVILIMLGYECWDLNRKLEKTNKTLDLILGAIEKGNSRESRNAAEC